MLAEPPPPTIRPDTTIKVKKATAYLKVVNGDGSSAEGSGFFAVEPGIVLTNAHVVGMLSVHSKQPRKIDILANSGQAGEQAFTARVVGVDRDNDLAVLRLQDDKSRWPAPLPVEFDMSRLTELQKVYIFGFPLGSDLGKEITASESSISSFRKEADGSLFQIQVNGGMHPGNSGGPVVDTRGVVIGVAVAGIRGTQINFAVPGEKILGLVNGRIQETRLGYPFRDGDQVKLPVTVACLDPLERVRMLQLEIWTGRPGKPRPASLIAPVAADDDSPRQTITVDYNKGAGRHDVGLAALDLPPGHVFWLQPLLVNQAGGKCWGSALAYKPSDSQPVERVPAQLSALVASGERSLKLAGKSTVQIGKGRQKVVESDSMNLDVLEAMEKTPNGAGIRLMWGKGQFFEDTNGRRAPKRPAAYAAINRHVHGFQCDANGALTSFGFVKFNFRDRLTTMDANDMAEFFVTSYQFVSLPLPNREVQPLETWNAKIRLILGREKKKEVMDLVLKCTYEGSRKVQDKMESLISLSGEVNVLKTERPLMRRPSDRVSGLGIFDHERGYLSKLTMALRDERDVGGIALTRTFDATVTRVPGNTFGINMPTPKGAAPPTVATRPGANGSQGLVPSAGNPAQEKADAAVAEELNKLQGKWVFERVERNDAGRVGLLEESIYPALYIENDIVRGTDKKEVLHSNSGRAKITIDPTAKPLTMDIVLQNDDPGATFLCIYKIEGDRLTIAMNTNMSKRETRPREFSTKLTAGPDRATNIHVYRRVPLEKAPVRPAPKVTQEQRDAAVADGFKKLQGYWIFEKAQRNDNSRVVLLDESIYPALYIENDIVRGTDKNGGLNINSNRAKLTIDPARTPMTMEIVLQNDDPGAKFLGIYKIDGNRLTIATHTSNRDMQPAQFTTSLTAGRERATDVLTYKRAQKPSP